jgi:hypothetical protein
VEHLAWKLEIYVYSCVTGNVRIREMCEWGSFAEL